MNIGFIYSFIGLAKLKFSDLNLSRNENQRMIMNYSQIPKL